MINFFKKRKWENMNRKKSKKMLPIVLSTGILLSSIGSFENVVSADAKVGDQYITLGQDLSKEQIKKVYENLGIEKEIPNEQIVYVTNEEEHQYLGSYIPKMQIGTNALSSTIIEIGEPNSGLIVSVDKNITYITEEMYTNALSTAGVTDVKVTITAPFEVSGTAALTGVIKAYETSTGKKIDEEQKQLANEEMVLTADLEKDVGDTNITLIIKIVKEEMSKRGDLTTEELEQLIKDVAKENNVQLNDEHITKIKDLLQKVGDLNIDWVKVNDKIDSAKNKIKEFTDSEKGQSFLNSVKSFFKKVVSKLSEWFNS